jgi:hypothetical protein
MSHYRAFILDEHGHVVGAVSFDCADDEEAKERVKPLGGQQVELWRQVWLLPGAPFGPEQQRGFRR